MMNRKNLRNEQSKHRLVLLPAFVLTLFLLGSIYSPLSSSSVKATPGKRVGNINASAKSITPPPAPVRLNSSALDGGGGEGGGGQVRCGGSSCQPNILVCSTEGTFLQVESGCCARCCWVEFPDNCSEITCCSSNEQ